MTKDFIDPPPRKGSNLSADIEKIKLHGIVSAIRDEIESSRKKLTDDCWRGVFSESYNRYVRLGTAIQNARKLLDRMEALFEELCRYESSHK